MSVFHTLPNGEVVPVPPDVVAQGKEAQQAFYDLQLKRLEAESDAPAQPVRRSRPAGSTD